LTSKESSESIFCSLRPIGSSNPHRCRSLRHQSLKHRPIQVDRDRKVPVIHGFVLPFACAPILASFYRLIPHLNLHQLTPIVLFSTAPERPQPPHWRGITGMHMKEPHAHMRETGVGGVNVIHFCSPSWLTSYSLCSSPFTLSSQR
jgi:hypothetical protein